MHARRMWNFLYQCYEQRLRRQIGAGRLPEHVGLILDGNRRYAREQSGPVESSTVNRMVAGSSPGVSACIAPIAAWPAIFSRRLFPNPTPIGCSSHLAVRQFSPELRQFRAIEVGDALAGHPIGPR
jgi:hypothetical protein